MGAPREDYCENELRFSSTREQYFLRRWLLLSLGERWCYFIGGLGGIPEPPTLRVTSCDLSVYLTLSLEEKVIRGEGCREIRPREYAGSRYTGLLSLGPLQKPVGVL